MQCAVNFFLSFCYKNQLFNFVPNGGLCRRLIAKTVSMIDFRDVSITPMLPQQFQNCMCVRQ